MKTRKKKSKKQKTPFLYNISSSLYCPWCSDIFLNSFYFSIIIKGVSGQALSAFQKGTGWVQPKPSPITQDPPKFTPHFSHIQPFLEVDQLADPLL
ncbi:uncharacterized protein VTP21DRAFT_8577 [Calcarisporiella thermophila]|uniref:uncharacterized protein n=1 Tax=Calcarisporiella thermophila TaxID=911321 RepID=UPI00374228E1